MSLPVNGMSYPPAETSGRRGVSYHAFPPMVTNGFTIGIEKLPHMMDEISVLHQAHWEETERLYLDQPVQASYHRYAELEELGQFVHFTARKNREMVGYLQYYLFPDMHMGETLTAREDAFFVVPAERGKGLAQKMLDYAEDSLKKLGCKYAAMTTKAPCGGPDISAFLERNSYRPVSTLFMKELKE